MKKYFLFSLLLVCSFFANAQEIIVDADTYVQYQDSLFILRTVQITNAGLDGRNDTIIRYIPPAVDTAGLIDLIKTKAINTANERVAFLRRSLVFRRAIQDNNGYDTQLNALGADLDETLVLQYGARIKGRYRLVTATQDFQVIIGDHPTRADVLRAVGTNNEGNFNVQIRGRWWLAITISGSATNLIWDGDNENRQVWRHPTFGLPNVMATLNPTRLIRLD